MVVQRVLICTSEDWETVPPKGYSGLARMAWGLAVELARVGIQVDLSAQRIDTSRFPPGLPITPQPWPPSPDLAAAVDVVYSTDHGSLNSLAKVIPALSRTLFVCEQNAPWLGGPRGPNVRHVIFRSDRLPSFQPGEAWLCDQILLRDEMGPPLPTSGEILWMGRIHSDKNPVAAATVAALRPNQQFLVVGPAHADEPIWSPNVRRIASVGGAEKASLLRSAAALLYTVSPDWIGAGELVLTEAAACGLPILAQSHAQGCPAGRWILEGINGFRRSSPQDLAALVPHTLTMNREAIYERFRERLDPATVASVRLSLMTNALAEIRDDKVMFVTANSPTPDSIAPAPGLPRLLQLGDALLALGEDHVSRGALETGAAIFRQGAAIMQPWAELPWSTQQQMAYARWIQLDCAARAQDQATALYRLWQFLLDHDERLKARKLLDIVPWMLQDHPLVVDMEQWTGIVRRHVDDKDAYFEFYAREHVPSPAVSHSDPRCWMTRATDAARLVAEHAPRGRILEVGCYDGPIGFPVLSECPDAHYVGVDYNAAALQRFQALLAHRGLRADLRTSLDRPDASFDVLIWTEVIEHVAEPVEELRHLLQWVRPGGLVFITTPWGSVELGRPPSDPRAEANLGHVRAMTPRDLLDVFDQADAQTRSLWHLTSFAGKGGSLHAVLENKPLPAKRVCFVDPHGNGVLPSIAHHLSAHALVEVFIPSREAAVVDLVRVRPLAQTRFAGGIIIAVDANHPGAAAVLWTGAFARPPCPSGGLVLVLAEDRDHLTLDDTDGEIRTLPPLDQSDNGDAWALILEELATLPTTRGSRPEVHA